MITDITQHKAYMYAYKVSKGKIQAPKYVKYQCKLWLKIADGKDKKYTINLKKVNKIDGLLHLFVMPKGYAAGKPLQECLAEFQYFFIIAVLCTVEIVDTSKRKYQNVILEIGRKNGKTLLTAIIFLILLLTEPKLSEFFSVGADGSISRLVMNMMSNIIDSSPEIESRGIFKVTNDYILCTLTKNKYVPLNYKNGRFDGREANVFLADEAGALPNNEPIESMRMSQVQIKNKLGIIISTKYPKVGNPFDNEVQYAKNVLDNITKDETLFALLYEPDSIKENEWKKGNKHIYQANPITLEMPAVFDELKKEQKRAITDNAFTGTFLCKQLNIQTALQAQETFISIGQLRKGRQQSIDFNGKDVYVGVDLALSTDNTAVTIAYMEDGVIYTYSIVFIPESRVEEKSKAEKVNYSQYINDGLCIACGGLKMDFSVIEKYIMNIPEMFNCNVVSIGFDPSNGQQMMNNMENAGFNVVSVRQNAATLHPTISYLRDKMLDELFRYSANEFYEVNFQNAKVTFDGGNRMYFSKKQCRGRIDLVMSTLDAVYLIYQNELENESELMIEEII